jgi:segregation and condensation protein B
LLKFISGPETESSAKRSCLTGERPLNREDLTAAIEAILLTARGPVAVSALVEALDDRDVTSALVEDAIEAMASSWDTPERGVRIEKVGGGWRCFTPPGLDSFLRNYHGIAARQRLSQAALEVLAIVAHRQPVTLPEINFLRGTNSASVVRTLLERKLLRMAGRKKVVGKPFLYRTSKEFLVHFGLDRPEDLPDPEEILKDEVGVAG